jgi:hypothetical protein
VLLLSICALTPFSRNVPVLFRFLSFGLPCLSPLTQSLPQVAFTAEQWGAPTVRAVMDFHFTLVRMLDSVAEEPDEIVAPNDGNTQ